MENGGMGNVSENASWNVVGISWGEQLGEFPEVRLVEYLIERLEECFADYVENSFE